MTAPTNLHESLALTDTRLIDNFMDLPDAFKCRLRLQTASAINMLEMQLATQLLIVHESDKDNSDQTILDIDRSQIQQLETLIEHKRDYLQLSCEPKGNMFGRSKQKEKSCGSQRVISWSISFENVLEDPIGLKTFTEFLKREFSAENIMFWVACKQYSTLSDKLQMIKLAKEIYDLHLRPGATEAVNINCHSRQFVLLNRNNPPPDLFAQAEKEIFTLMKFDCYQRFLKSELYTECITAEKLGKPLPCSYLCGTKSPSRTRFRSKSRDRNRIQHSKKANSTNYSINQELTPPSAENSSKNRRSFVSSKKDIDALWNRLQQRLDDQRGTELNFDIPDFLCTDASTSVS